MPYIHDPYSRHVQQIKHIVKLNNSMLAFTIETYKIIQIRLIFFVELVG